ncbi:hypothetical protein GEMRC1_007991 [Eukaryota sp. GEM-RC1]
MSESQCSFCDEPSCSISVSSDCPHHFCLNHCLALVHAFKYSFISGCPLCLNHHDSPIASTIDNLQSSLSELSELIQSLETKLYEAKAQRTSLSSLITLFSSLPPPAPPTPEPPVLTLTTILAENDLKALIAFVEDNYQDLSSDDFDLMTSFLKKHQKECS